mmetsp:Transcript_10047/g.23940  ORF Transcript_10047/g.23940 Transcript_10047/m.23940 type:complete len:570 (-) Transcript_10047:310-2019(-)
MAKSKDKKKGKSKADKKNVEGNTNAPPPPLPPQDLELDPIPEDNSVAAPRDSKLSSASAVASSNSSQDHPNGRDSGRSSDVGGSAVNELMYGAQEQPSQQDEAKPPPLIYCNKRVRVFALFLLLLLTGIGVGIIFIVQAIDDDDSGDDSNNNNNLRQPTIAPTYPTFDDVFINDGGGSGWVPAPAPTYSPMQIQSIDDILIQLSAETKNIFSETVNLNDPSTPHGNCRFWLTQTDEIDLNVNVGQAAAVQDVERIQQRYILCLLFEQTSGQNWQLGNNGTSSTSSATFKDKTAHECTWEGVTCNGNDYVAVLDLWNQNLVGRIPDEITSLETLQVLRLPNNTLVGTIPERLLDLPNLLWLDLSNNQLTGSVVSSTATSGSPLLTLYLNSNALQGTIPYFSQLTSLRIHGNQFSELNPLYTTSTPLKRLVAYDNKFQGDFPQSWNLPNLIHLDLGLNQWKGSIPLELWQNLPSLEFLLLNEAQLKGNLPATTASPFLSYVWLQSNQLTGTVPETFGQNWLNLTSLQLQGNPDLSGSIGQAQCVQWQQQGLVEVIRADCNLVSCSCCTSCS